MSKHGYHVNIEIDKNKATITVGPYSKIATVNRFRDLFEVNCVIPKCVTDISVCPFNAAFVEMANYVKVGILKMRA